MSQRPQFSQNDYHDLVAFQAFQIMQLQMAVGARDQEVQRLAAELAAMAKGPQDTGPQESPHRET